MEKTEGQTDFSEIYYHGKYWNDIACVAAEINRRFTGDSKLDWVTHFQQTTNRVFKRALFINCGNGWVERNFIDRGLILEAVGLDVSEVLLEEARKNADGRALRYYAGDINLANFVEDGFDLVVNHAAAHHIRFVDRVFRKIALCLSEDGYLVNMDYVGPHRNQYPEKQWNAARMANATLPESCRAELAYPHLMTMLATDPTEAVHSELVIPSIYKYFEVTYHARAGGAVAYPVLTHNQKLFEQSVTDREAVSATIMEADLAYLEEEPTSSLFDYIVATPKHKIAQVIEQQGIEDRIETEREEQAIQSGGYYKFPAWPDTEVSFKKEDCGSRFFCEGLSSAEPHGAWTDGHSARIRFEGPHGKPFKLEFSVSPFLGLNVDNSGGNQSNKVQRVFVLLNGRYLLMSAITSASKLLIEVPENRVHPIGEYELTFIFPDAIPCVDEAGAIVDARLLGLAFSAARLELS